MKSCTVCADLQMLSPTLNSGDWNGLDAHTGCRAPEFQKKTYGSENISWKTSGEATQEVDRCCVPGPKGAAGCQKTRGGKLRIGRVGGV
jgi:hypothetical protein